MSFDELQLAWQHDQDRKIVTPFDPVALARVQANSRKFARQIFWRDVREVLASFLVAGVFGNIAWQAQLEGATSWPSWIAAILPLLVGFYFLADRWIMRSRAVPQGNRLLLELDRAIRAVEHQVWLLRNVAWWYLAPLALSTILLGVQITVFGPEGTPYWAKIAVWILIISTTAWMDRWIWQLNQNAVSSELEPHLVILREQRNEFGEEV